MVVPSEETHDIKRAWRQDSRNAANFSKSLRIGEKLELYLAYKYARQHIKKQRYYFSRRVNPVKAKVFSVIMCGYERWIIKKAEC